MLWECFSVGNPRRLVNVEGIITVEIYYIARGIIWLIRIVWEVYT